VPDRDLVSDINAAIHDDWFDLDSMVHDVAQEEMRLKIYFGRRTGRVLKVSRPPIEKDRQVPIGELIVRGAVQVTIEDDADIGWYDVDRVDFDGAAGQVVLRSNFPLEITIQVKKLDVELVRAEARHRCLGTSRLQCRLCRLAIGVTPMSTLSYAISGTDRERLASAFASANSAGPVTVQTDDGVIELPAAAADAVRHLLVELASGASVHVLADDAELTTQEAADLLGISRTYLVRLVDDGKVDAHLVGTHRRLRAADVLAYQAQRGSRLRAVAEIAEADAAVGVPYR